MTAKFSRCVLGRVAAVGLLSLGAASGCGTVEGMVKLSGGSLGDREFKPESCQSGHRHGFFGADLYADSEASEGDQTSEGYQPYKIGQYVRLVPTRTRTAAAPGGLSLMRVASDVFRGPLVRLYGPALAQGYIDFTPEVCQKLQVVAQDRGYSYSVIEGTLQLQCALADGTTAAGMVRFFSCH